MRFLEQFVDSPAAGALGWAILHSLWEAAILAALLGIVLLALRSPRARYAAGCVAMLLMFLGFAFTLIHLWPTGTAGTHNAVAPMRNWSVASTALASNDWFANLKRSVPWLAPVWLAGVWFVYLERFMGCVSVWRLRRRGVCAAPDRWQHELSRLGLKLHLSRSVQLLESSLAEVPVVLGHLRPAILMPIGLLAGLSPGQIEAILLHELAHIRRHDYLVNVFQRLIEGLFFYHPAVWWISSVIRAERENCCDDMVVSVTANPREYALTLAALEQKRFSGRQPAAAFTGGRLMNRIHRLLYPKTHNVAWTPLLGAAMLLTVGAVSLAAWQASGSSRELSGGAAAQDANSAAAMEKAAKDSQASRLETYAKWLNQDVVYIIDDAERAAFRNLQTNAERDKFIEQFWERRNPTPGSSKNAFKDEHYRRIAYANEHLRTASGAPGWQTDRGHVLILYGAPDEIDSHPKDGEKPALEYWTYRHVEGVGDNVSMTFVDRTGRGDYHLAPGSAH